MIYFKTTFLNFLADLEVYNNREWFNANKERFKSEVDEERPRTNSNREKVETREETPVEDNTTKQKEPVPQTPTRDVPAIDMNTTGKS